MGFLIGCTLWLSASLLLQAGTGRAEDINAALGLAGSQVLLLIGIFVAAALLRIVAPDVLHKNAQLLLLSLAALMALLSAKALLEFTGIPTPVAEFLIPYALAPLLATMLLGNRAGTVLGFWTSYACAILLDRSFGVFLTGMVCTVVVACIASHVRRRTQVFRIGLVLGLAEVVVVPALTDLGAPHLQVVMLQSLACLASGLASAILALLILPLFETLFSVTTDVTLLELSDLSHPLMQRLAIEAPGTYHHSLVVANLAQGAADEIRANALLARVGAYFHDIGKLTKPQFFTENIAAMENPHDHLAPSMSALLIAAHVKEGLGLGMLYRLPPSILDIIQQHHGTGVMTFFLHKADQQDQSAGKRAPRPLDRPSTNESGFRYPGPRPVTREAALIMLADAVEAASRSLEKPTPGHVQNLVERITNSRIEDGQFDACDMTFAELGRVRRSFVFTLTNMLHSRIAYPGTP
jgi:cyclic-di-AMP phosphodiesterase PgpH